MFVGCWAGVSYLRYTVHCRDPALSVLVMLVSRNVFHAVSALQSSVSKEKRKLIQNQARMQKVDFGLTYMKFAVVMEMS